MPCGNVIERIRIRALQMPATNKSPDRPLTVGLILLGTLVLFLLAGAIPVDDGRQTVVFRTPAFLLVLLALALSSMACCLHRRSPGKQAGFVLAHLGMVAILVGALWGYLGGVRSRFTLPLTTRHHVSTLPGAGGHHVDLGFKIQCTNFSVAFYAPEADSNQPPIPRRYDATLILTEPTGAVRQAPLAVNHPVTHEGWRFYLVSYVGTPPRALTLSARKDPGRRLVVGGIWCLMGGVTWLCFRRREVSHELT